MTGLEVRVKRLVLSLQPLSSSPECSKPGMHPVQMKFQILRPAFGGTALWTNLVGQYDPVVGSHASLLLISGSR